MSFARKLLRCRRGGSALESAIILPSLFLVVMLIIETSWQMAIAAGVDHGTRRGARWTSLGAEAPAGMTRMDRLAEIILTSTGLPLNAGRLTITPTAFPSYSALNTPGAGVAGLGGPDQVVRYVVQYRSTLLTPMAQQILSSDFLTYRAVFVVQNEPYPG